MIFICQLPTTSYQPPPGVKAIIDVVFRRQRTGSVICTSCGVLVGVDDDRCYNCDRRNPGLWGFAPLLRSLGQDLGFGPFVIGACVVIYALMLVFSMGSIGMQGLGFASPSQRAMFLFGASGAYPVFEFGRWWTVLSAGWLHGGLLHIFFNLMALRQLAPSTADLYGPGRMVIIYVAGSVAGFVLSTLAAEFIPPLVIIPRLIVIQGAQFTVGSSASIAGLIGAVLAYGHRSGSGQARAYAMQYVWMLLIMGFLLPFVDNYAHAGGFAGGYLMARTLDPLKAERIDHMVIAVGCLLASLLSIAVSVMHGLQFLRPAE
jgi:rhomboid protease GluP